MEEEKSLFDLFTEKNHNVSRRSFLKTCGLSVLLAGLPLNLTRVFADGQAQLGAAMSPDHMMLTLAADPRTTQTIAWRTDSNAASGAIQWIKTETFNKSTWDHAMTMEASIDKLNSDLGDINVHYATLANLKPGTHYTYRVGNGQQWSDSFVFTTEQQADKPFKFMIFGDSQSGLPKNPEYGPWRTTIHNAYNAHSDAAFFMMVGDLVEVGQSYEHWNHWYAAAKDVIERMPVMAAPGNHETYDVPEENHSVMPFYFTTQVKMPLNGPDALKGQAYSFDYGNVHFAVIDSQEDEEGPYVPDMLKLEAEWLDQDLTATTQKWKLVLFHKTPYYNKAVRANEKLKAALLPVIDKHHVDLVINGHDHGYSRTYPLYQDSFVSTPDQGTVYVVAGRSGNKFYPDLSQKIWDAFFHDPQAEPNYVVVEVNGEQLTVKAYTQSGELIDNYTIDKAQKTDIPLTILPERANDTRLVVWGNMLQTPLVTVPPRKISDVWYLPVQPFFEFIGGTVTMSGTGQVAAKYSKTTINLQLNDTQALLNNQAAALQYPVTEVQGTPMIAAEDLKSLTGFNYKYDAVINMLLLAK